MRYSEELIEEVRAANNIVDVVGSYVHLQKKGANYFGLCPFHNEKSASFSVTPNKQIYYCFGCGAGGNVISFVMNYENYTFKEAVQFLAKRAGIALPAEEEETPEMKREQSHRARLLQVNKEAATYYYYQLRAAQGKLGMEYLRGRQLSQETMNRFGLGFSNKTGRDLNAYLKKKGFNEQLILEAGLANADEKHGMYDKFWNRVMFPIQDINHRVIGFGGRVMGDGKPKYLNSPETPIFDKSRNLYGLNFARTSRKGSFILCEGYMDVIAMHQAGFDQAVASLGTAFTIGQATLLKRYSSDILLSYDSDGAGVKAALRAIGILKEAGMSGRIINLEPYKDPDEFIKNLGQEEFQKRLDQAENSFLFEIRMLEREFHLNDPEEKTKFYRAIAKKLCEFPEEMERENYIEAVARKYRMGTDSLRHLVSDTAARNGGYTPRAEQVKSGIKPKAKTPEENDRRTQRLLLTWLTEEPELYGPISRYITADDFTVELYRRVAEMLFRALAEGRMNAASIISTFEDEEEQRQVAELFNTKLVEPETPEEQEKAIRDIVIGVKKISNRYHNDQLTNPAEQLMKAIEDKKTLEQLEKVRFHAN